MAVNNLDEANMVVAVAAGNSGAGDFAPPHVFPAGHYTIESPGSAERALTAGAFTVGHFVGVTVTDNDTSDTYAAAVGDFAHAGSTGDLSANLGTACTAIADDLSGMIALINRGTCTFSTKVRNAQDAGAEGVIIVNNVFGPPIAMGSDGTANQPTIDAVQVSKSDQAALNAATGDSFSIGSTLSYVADPAQSNYMAGFSSQGPTDVDYRVKPDVSAPGVNVLSSIPVSECGGDPCFAFFQGTSMATPHLAGSAAIVKWLHPTWPAWAIRSAVVNTADQNVLLKAATGAPETDVLVTGNGRENLLSAGQAFAVLSPVSVSFGAVPSGQGGSYSMPVTIMNTQGSGYTYSLSVGAGGGGISYSLSTSSIWLAAGASGTFWVNMTADKGADLGDHSAQLHVSGSAGYAHAIVYTFVKN
jgi:hypothetical protein